MIKVECPKCAGQKIIKAFSAIAGGVCFSCNGHGFVERKSVSKKSIKWAVKAMPKDGGQMGVVFFLRAKNAASALREAQQRLQAGSYWISETATVEAA